MARACRATRARFGYATEAADAIRDASRNGGVQHLVALIRPHNVASQRVATKIG
ncbi:GNAT family N-acetyltransferase [Pseudactinotalea sp.]|uniref:GNAT family N-acetyltransferase n=1 Tax=Pseudactinotalea sp. TaxID=1926260 RepID=UPI003B3AD536